MPHMRLIFKIIIITINDLNLIKYAFYNDIYVFNFIYLFFWNNNKYTYILNFIMKKHILYVQNKKEKKNNNNNKKKEEKNIF
ncbi:hypothetical protein PFAG_01500 [Plasmodium falciparum Santa Lucia]|uniref:Uncharacterized protein n=3 Tax=Plasmodium falciparum TaxID=5833 RepID=A0A024WBR6_PLAFA|nr:hypothetical protein PFFVO_01530 [Plasmodium falciparum Vietnam Oak-Knoll (FVO)]ETW37681.1 hypothetical protein PFTANZ_01607 [Plasmodium falciparum Tanzania (2000708)]EUT89347.1 hypothetical protein PFAG_01500 [Plasmodium falciparum Santa Lucia]